MKLLLVSGIYPPDVGGPATFLPQLAAYCQEEGHDVKILTLTDNFRYQHNQSRWRVIRVARCLPLPIRFLTIFAIVFMHLLLGYRIFSNGLHEECGLALLLFRGKGVAKIVGDPIWERAINKFETNLDIESFNSSKLSWNFAFQRSLLKFGLNQFHTVITPSQQLQNLVKQWKVESNLKVILNGVTIKNPTKHHKSIDVITVCRLVAWKNVDLLIEAANNCDFSLCVVGDGPELSRLSQLAQGNPKIDIRGRMSQFHIDELLSSSKVFALISDYEGLSFSLLQAMSFGLPVVVSNSSGNAEVVRQSANGFIVDPRANGQLGSIILGLLEKEEDMKKFSQKSLDGVNKFYNIEACLKKTTQTLEY